jgi:radical SAM protein with 4Fe4S-binding SPASM domain
MNPQGTNEPLLDPKFEDYIKFASQHGFIDISMNTNATLLSEERANKLLESGVTRLRFSLDAATKETYEKIRIGAKFEPVMKNIERFLEIKQRGGYELPVVGVNLCRMKINEHEIDQFIEMWKDKVDLVAIQNFIAPDFETDYTDFIPTNSEYHKNLKENFRCEQPWQRVYIKSSGEVCPCCTFFNEELSLGNIEEHTIHELWNGEKMKRLQDLHKEGRYSDNPVCLNCVKCTTGVKNDSELINIK